MWGGRAFLHRKTPDFHLLSSKMGAPPSDQRDPVAALFFFLASYAILYPLVGNLWYNENDISSLNTFFTKRGIIYDNL